MLKFPHHRIEHGNTHPDSTNNNNSEMSKEESSQIKFIFGAGVLPYAWKDNEIWFLLGKERRDDTWEGSEKWSSFGGKRELNQTVEQTAIREFYEESMGTIMTLREIQEKIYRKEYIICADINVSRSRYFRIYIINIPKINYNIQFQKTRVFVDYIGCKNQSCKEKTKLQWFSARQLQNIINDKWDYKRDGIPPLFREAFLMGIRVIFKAIDINQFP